MRARSLGVLVLASLLGGCAANADIGPGFDADLRPDLPAADMGADRTLTAIVTPLGALGSPRGLAIGDVDGRAGADVVVTDAQDDTVRVLRNQGGAFPAGERTSHPAGRGPGAVAIGDLDGDSRPDLLVSRAGDSALSLLRNQGAGAFPTQLAQVSVIPVAPSPGALLLADLDGDKALDVALGHGEGDAISVLLAKAGALQAPRTYLAGRFLYALGALPRAAGPPDLLVASAGTDSLAVLRNQGGTFQRDAAAELRTSAIPVAVYVGDLNDDGRADVAVANYGDDSVSVLVASGVGTYVTTVYTVGRRPVAIGAGDLDGDGLPDLLVANQDSDDLSILASQGNAFFVPYRLRGNIGARPVALGVADLDGAPPLEAVVASRQGGALSLVRVGR